jgi:hypothetical protein
MINRLVIGLLLWLMAAGVKGQSDSLRSQKEDGKPIRARALFVPGVLTVHGFTALNWEALKSFDRSVQRSIWQDNPHRPFFRWAC